MQNETPEGTDKDLRTVRVAPFWEQNQPSLLLAAPDEAAPAAVVAACRTLGIRAHLVHTGAAALISYGRFAPDLVIIGPGLPDFPVETLAAAIAADTGEDAGTTAPDRSGTPVLLVIADGAERPDQEHSTEVLGGYEDVLTSPLFTALADRSKNPWSSDEELSYGSLVMRLAAFEVSDAGTPVVLTLREFELLRVLLLARGQAVSLGKLKTDVWGAVEEEVRTDTVKVHMNRLRQKLTGPTRPVAVRGIGYILKNTGPA